ncbi:hypothetical protein P8C59_000489 [Phyllachora maydis]|uniref:Uncharacterized protein n=1 Tax=Phyllachora maydis TaxID=1825666 RepID=A0AAD9HW71_9PEZI|nr:hypothetical protein P8C59_000489 [Phyllachora maydis]
MYASTEWFYISTGDPEPIQTLTDNTRDEQDSGRICEWDGLAEPRPPGVGRAYWYRLYKQADEAFEDDQHEVNEACRLRGLEVTMTAKEHAQAMRIEGYTYEQAVFKLVQDLCAAHLADRDNDRDDDTRDELFPVRTWTDKKRDAILATRPTGPLTGLNRTADGVWQTWLGEEFFEFMEEHGYTMKHPRDRNGEAAEWRWQPRWFPVSPNTTRSYKRRRGQAYA